MRTSLRGLAGLAATGLFAITAVAASAAPAERELLGIRIWRSWRDVLAKHGQPTQIEVGAVSAPTQGAAGGMMGGGMTGGQLPGLGGMGMPGAPMGMAGPMMMGGSGMMGGGKLGAMRAGGPMGSSGMAGPMMGGSGMMSGRPMGMGGPMMMGGSGMMGGGGLAGFGTSGSSGGAVGMGGTQPEAGAEGEVTWIYKKGSLTYMFLFNKDGRVIQIQEFGYKGGSTTARGVALGDPVRKVYSAYSWPDSSVTSGDQLTLDYSHKSHVTFQLSKGKVVGITIALTERSQIPTAPVGGMMGGGMSSGGPAGRFGGGGAAE